MELIKVRYDAAEGAYVPDVSGIQWFRGDPGNDGTTGIFIKGLEKDTEYFVSAVAREDMNSGGTAPNPDKTIKVTPASTLIDPFEPRVGTSSPLPGIYRSDNKYGGTGKIIISNIQNSPQYQFALVNDGGTVISAFTVPDGEGKLTFNNINGETECFLVAKNTVSGNDGSEMIPMPYVKLDNSSRPYVKEEYTIGESHVHPMTGKLAFTGQTVIDNTPVVFGSEEVYSVTDKYTDRALNAGTYTVRVKYETGYGFMVVDKNWEISRQIISIKINDQETPTGEPIEPLTYEFVSGMNYESADHASAEGLDIELSTTVSTDAEGRIISVPGIYTISAAVGGSDSNYSISATDAEYTVLKPRGNAFVTADDVVYSKGMIKPSIAAASTTHTGLTPVFSFRKSGSEEFDLDISQVIDVGEYEVKALFPETEYYSPTPAFDSFKVLPASLTVTANDKISPYGEPLKSLDYYVSGGCLYEGDELGAVLETAADSYSDIGDYPITIVSTSNPNYDVRTESGVYTIIRAEGEAAIQAGNIVYSAGNELPAPEVVSTTNIGATPFFRYRRAGDSAFDLQADEVIDVGTYEVQAFIPQTDHYLSVLTEPKQFEVLPRDITIVANNAYGVYAEPIPAFAYRILGNKYDRDNLEVNLYTNAERGSEPGEYPINIDYTPCANYNITVIPGVLTIGKGIGRGRVYARDVEYGNPLDLTPESETNGISDVTYRFRTFGGGEYTDTVPDAIGTYDVEATFAGNMYYEEAKAYATFRIYPHTTATAYVSSVQIGLFSGMGSHIRNAEGRGLTELAERHKPEEMNVEIIVRIMPDNGAGFSTEGYNLINDSLDGFVDGISNEYYQKEYFDISIEKYVTDPDDNLLEESLISDTEEPIELILEVGEEVTSREPVMFREHDGETVTLKRFEAPREDYAEEGYYIDRDGGFIHLYSRYYSEYAITYLDADVYTVSFDTAGGSAVSPVKVLGNRYLGLPAGTYRDGYVFTGWYLNGRLYDFSEPVTSDMVLTAGWEEIKRTKAPEIKAPEIKAPKTSDTIVPEKVWFIVFIIGMMTSAVSFFLIRLTSRRKNEK